MSNQLADVWVLRHFRITDDGHKEMKLIGVYTSYQLGEEAIKITALLPGFADFPGEFDLKEHVINQDNWTSGFISNTTFLTQ